MIIMWAVDENQEILYRYGTCGENDPEGSSCVRVVVMAVVMMVNMMMMMMMMMDDDYNVEGGREPDLRQAGNAWRKRLRGCAWVQVMMIPVVKAMMMMVMMMDDDCDVGGEREPGDLLRTGNVWREWL